MRRGTAIGPTPVRGRSAEKCLLRSGQVDLWLRTQDELVPEDFERLTSVAERERAALLPLDRRQRFLATRAWLRTILARYLDQPAEIVQIALGPAGKPFVANQAGAQRLEFSLSHSGHFTLLAIGETPLGVDFELLEKIPEEYPLIAAQQFSPTDYAWWRDQPVDAQPGAFLEVWTRLEATLKAEGTGFSPGAAATRPRTVMNGAPEGLMSLDLGAECRAGLASFKAPVTGVAIIAEMY